MLSSSSIEKILNCKTIKKNHPDLIYVKVFKSRKGFSIGAKYTSNKFKVSPKESEKLKESIKDLLFLSSFDITFINIFYFRIFDNDPIDE
jgi:hypothetical protein